MDFDEYNGWPNFPTWSVFQTMSDQEETYQELYTIAHDGPLPRATVGIARFVQQALADWREGKATAHKQAAYVLAQEFLRNSVRQVDWTIVYDTLRGKRQVLGAADELTTLAYTLLQSIDWRSIVGPTDNPLDVDVALKDWLQGQCIAWTESLDARRYQSKATAFASKALEIYVEAVDWEHIASALREE